MSAIRRGRGLNRYPSDRRDGAVKTPNWTNIIEVDLQDPSRLQRLYEAAIVSGHLRRSESSQLFVFAAAVHALRVAKRNACGLFATVVKRGLRVISQVDEDAARVCLQRWRFDESHVPRRFPKS